MKYTFFALLLSFGTFVSCDASTDNDSTETTTVTEKSTDGVNAKSGGETSTYEDQSTKSSLTTGTADYDGKNKVPDQIATDNSEKLDTIRYLQTPEIFSTSPVKKGNPNATENN
ncbi:hypothetical protein [Neolewinella antarctica]|uniref:Uncharacterized protein n=1 Tax=Neolewinella antarctica TaxID=442734 RepID=A0ABX0X8N9_9BACT|nr:hypothetical protein [Neolewinella antarctica]NJC25537.1 hypothetical protein [Neolewinella antarctica]